MLMPDYEYQQRCLQEAYQQLMAVEKAPLADRKEAAAQMFDAMREHPDIIGERIGWLLDGSYGCGPYLKARQVLDSPRMNREAALTQMVGVFEWQSPGAMTIAAWKKLTATEKKKLDKVVKAEIKAAEQAAEQSDEED